MMSSLKSSNFPRLPDKTLTVVTVFGKERQTFARNKLKVRKTNNKFQNLCTLYIPEIGQEKLMDSDFIGHILHHFPFKFNPQVINKIDTTSSGKIHVLIGSNLSSSSKHPISNEQLSLKFHAAIHQNFNFFQTPFASKISMFGHVGIDPDLVDGDYPEFLVHKSIALDIDPATENVNLESDFNEYLQFSDPEIDSQELRNICNKS